LNLVSNAIKFTERGEVAVEVETYSREHGPHPGQDVVRLHVRVRDTGIGIREDKRAAIFESYTQADGITQHKFGGTGLGLAISARLVELMGGRIWVESEIDKGSVFHFTMPVEIPAEAATDAGDAASHQAETPSADASPAEREGQRSTLRRSLEDWGVHVVEAASAEAARRASVERPRSGDAAGRGERRRSLAETQAGAPRAMNVLLAEDSLVNQRVTSGLLESRGHWVDVVATGTDAVKSAARQRYDLVLMDLEMPEMGGLEATAAIRAREAAQGGHVPIFALTARATAEDRVRCLAAGMDGYLVKPVRQVELLALAEGLAAGRRAAQGEAPRARAPVAATAQGGDSPAAAAAGPAQLERDGEREATFPVGGPIDWKAVLRGVAGDLSLLERVIEATLEEGPALLAELRRRARSGDAAGLHRAAHKLEGTLRTIHDDELIARAEEIELRARRGELDSLQERVEELVGRLEPVFAALHDWRLGGRNPT
jgi:CheY-like chemotaxis protein/HPt (histidine-containing phosphotransfer) domain-containing protein